MSDVFIVSDLHLGCEHVELAKLRTFLEHIPAQSTLICNGDTLDQPSRQLPDAHEHILNWLKTPPKNIRIIIIEGNHDAADELLEWGIYAETRFFLKQHAMLITHGASFDDLMGRHRWFIKIFRMLHNWRVNLGAPPVHVARYAKQWKPLYNVLCRNVQKNALLCAAAENCRTVACGHVHSSDDSRNASGIRYMNTGTWTEPDTTFFIHVNDSRVTLNRWR